MKLATILTSLFSFLALGMISSAQQDPLENEAKLIKSAKAWAEMKKQSAGNYTYQQIQSFMMGNRNVTTITVKNNVVVERKYEKFPVEGKPELIYKEKGDKLGTNNAGADAKTIDELHAVAKARLTEKLPDHQVLSMYFNKQGLITACMSRDTRIADDAPTVGFSIYNLKLEAPAKK